MFGAKKVKEIVEGYTNFFLKREQELGQQRIAYCYECPLYSKQKDLCDATKCINPETGDIKSFKANGYICGCGCFVKKKVLSPSSHCPLNKW